MHVRIPRITAAATARRLIARSASLQRRLAPLFTE
jgi:hypothetical protein